MATSSEKQQDRSATECSAISPYSQEGEVSPSKRSLAVIVAAISLFVVGYPGILPISSPVLTLLCPERPFPEYPLIPSKDLKQVECLSNWTLFDSYPPEYRTSFTLDVASGLTFATDIPETTWGKLAVNQAEDQLKIGDQPIPDNHALVEMSIGRYYDDSQSSSKRPNVCIVSNLKDGSLGVGIFDGPAPLQFNESIRINIHVTLPPPPSTDAAHDSHLLIPSFTAQLPLFEHFFGSIGQGVHFQDVNLRTTSRGIHAFSMNATNINMATQRGVVSGRYEANSSIKLTSSEGLITPSVFLSNENPDVPTVLEVSADKWSAVDVTANLTSRLPDNEGGRFDVTAHISRSRGANLAIFNGPVNHVLSLNAYLCGSSDAIIDIPPTFEGAFAISKKPFSHVFVDARLGLGSIVSFQERWWSLFGETWWGGGESDRTAERGNVHVKVSSFSQLRLGI